MSEKTNEQRRRQVGLQQLERDFEALLLQMSLKHFLRGEDLEDSVSIALGLLPTNELAELIALVKEEDWENEDWVRKVIAEIKMLKR